MSGLLLAILSVSVLIFGAVLGHWLEIKSDENVNKRFEEIQSNYNSSSVEEKVWLYCHYYDMIVEPRKDGVYIRQLNSSFYYDRMFSTTWTADHIVRDRCRFSDLADLLKALENYKGLPRVITQSIVTIKPNKPPSKQKQQKQEDLSHLLEGLEDPEEIRVIESIIKRSKQ